MRVVVPAVSAILISLVLVGCKPDVVRQSKRLAESEVVNEQEMGISVLSSVMRAEDDHRALARYLIDYVEENTADPASYMAELKLADTLLELGKDEDALAATRNLERRAGAAGKDTWVIEALYLRASILADKGDQQGARDALVQSLNIPTGDRNTIHKQKLKLAEVHLRLEQDAAAVDLLDDIIKNAQPGDALLPFAESMLARAQSNRSWLKSDRAELIEDLRDAFGSNDAARVLALATQSGSFGMGFLATDQADVSLKELELILNKQFNDSPKPSVHENAILRESIDKAYLELRNWNEVDVTGPAWLVLTDTELGWEWRGIAFSPSFESDPVFASRIAKDAEYAQAMPPPDGQPLRRSDFPAPWREGGWLASGPGRLFSLGYIPPGRCADIGGAAGSYYGANQHQRTANPGTDDFYAIDFNRWGGGIECVGGRIGGFLSGGGLCTAVPAFPEAGMEVRSISAGFVSDVFPNNGQVEVRHLGPGGIETGYLSVYAHMSPIYVRQFDPVAQGQPLGKVNDVGQATGNHLHFSIKDDMFGGFSVMPNPIDGVPRPFDARVACIRSSNNNLFVDADADTVPDAIDNCPGIENRPVQGRQADQDANGIGDACDDFDGDSVLDISDNCVSDANPDQSNIDGDALGDACDSDADGDSVANTTDNCPFVPNPFQRDWDSDGIGDYCDDDIDGDGIANVDDECPHPSDAFDCARPAVLDWLATAERLEVVYQTMPEIVNIPIGPICPRGRPCPANWFGIEIGLLNVSRDLDVLVRNASGDDFGDAATIRRRSDNVYLTVSQSGNEQLFVSIFPRTEAALGEKHSISVSVGIGTLQPSLRDVLRLIEYRGPAFD